MTKHDGPTVTQEAEQLRSAAEAGPIGKRQSSMELYHLLAACMPRKRAKVTVEIEDDIIDRLADLHKQATVERSHYYTGKCIRDAIAEIQRLRAMLALSK